MYLHQLNTNRMPGPGDLCYGPDDTEGPMSEDDAIEQAQQELCANPGAVAQWLEQATFDDNNVVDTRKLSDHLPELTVGQLLALLMTCDQRRMASVVYELRERLCSDPENRQWIEERAQDLIAESTEPDADPYGDDPHHWY